ncbi:MAG: hypothetical protein RL728_1028 [Bacteroidota bacterium]|jgi:hypothetical protein
MIEVDPFGSIRDSKILKTFSMLKKPAIGCRKMKLIFMIYLFYSGATMHPGIGLKTYLGTKSLQNK